MSAFASAPAFSSQVTLFHPLAEHRVVAISGELRLFDTDTRETESAVFQDRRESLPSDPLSVPMRLGMDINVGTCFGQGIATQSLFIGGDKIVFEGTADVNMNGYASQPKMLDGIGGAEVGFGYRFRLDAPQTVRVALDSTVGDFREDDFKFSLTTGDQVVWAATAVTGDDGLASRNFYRDLLLGPGVYDLRSTLTASSSISGDYAFAGRTWAAFSVSAVPEPHAWLMLLLGCGVIVARKRMWR